MKKLVFSALTFGLLMAGAFSNSISAVQVSYTADNTSIFRNPERGFTEEISAIISDTENHLLVGNEDFFDEDGVRPTETLCMILYNLQNYRDKALSSQMLQGFNDDMQVLRNKGFKCVLRFAYTEDEGDKNDAGKTRVLAHIAQLKPYLAANADVIYAIETGFVGVWGEWFYSDNFENESQHLNDNRRAVLTAMLDACPSDRFLLVRYPLIKIEYLGDEIALTSNQAFSGTDRARIGHHNDAFLNDWGNEGTYGRDDDETDDDPVLRQYIANETLYVPNGGETNVEESSDAERLYAGAESEMSTYHWSFCGESYAEAVTNRWKSSGIFDNLNRKMGYRYQLVTATLPDQAAIGGTANVNIQIKNVGYAPLYNERHVYLVLKNETQKYSIQLQSDPRRWLPNDAVTTINEQITIPTNVPEGTYQMYLHMPDKYASLASDPRFSVRFANTGVWDTTTGMNNLNASVTITSGGGGSVTPVAPTNVNYTSDNSIFANPERGFLLQLEKKVTATAPYNVKGREWFLQQNAAQNQSLVLVLYYLDNFKTTATLPNEILNAFDEDMAVLRQYGFKCVLRFAYTNSSSGEIGYDATPAIVTSHISQLASHLQANADVIYTFEAGFVGSWGEWYYTNNFGNKSQDINADRRAVIDALLAAVPTDRCVMLRYPCMKIQYLNNDANPLTETEAYQNTSKARLAHHNDAFLNNWGDCGTYYYNGNDDSPAMRQYTADETLYVPNGGETNVESSSLANTNCTYEKTIAACSTYHWSFCKGDYAEATTNKWRTDGTYAEMEKKLGYRYELVTATLPAQAAIGGTANVNIQIKNVGFAPIYNERHVYLVLKNGTQKYSIQLQSDPRRWLPNDAVTTINEQITIPTSVPEGTYQMYLHMPDKYASLASDPRFSVRFANTGVWDATTGMNSLNASVTIVSSGTVIPTTPTINVQTEVAFAGVTVGTPAIQQIAVSGNDLEGIVNINSDNAALTVNPTSLTSNEVQSGILVTLTLTATTAGNGNATLTFSSVNAASKTVNVTWNATSGGGGEDPGPSTPDQGQYSTRVYNADSTVCTWNFQDVVSADATINIETTDNGIIYRPASGGKIKIIAGASNGLSTQKTQSTVCIPVPAGSAGTISATMYGNSDSRYFQLYVNGTASSSDKRIWSKYNATPTSDGKKGPQSFTFTESDLTKIGDNYYLVLTDNTTEMKVATFTVTLTTGSYAVGGGEQGGEGGGGDTPTPPSTDAVELPATLNKANVNAVSSDMTYWQTDYFDFGPTDAENIGRWAEWKVYLRYPGKYIISVVNGFPGDDNADGNTWQLELLNGSTSVSIFTGENLWAQAQYTYSAKWDLSAKAVGEYTLRLKNTAAWEQPKLRSVTLQYDGVLPTGLEDVMLDMNAPMYDVLGRKVGADYHGVVIQNGKAFLK